MKRLVLLFLIAVFILAGILPLYGAGQTVIVLTIGSVNAQVNDVDLWFDVAPFIKDGRTFVPLRFVSEQLGAKVYYTSKADGSVDRVTIVMGTEVASATPTPKPTPTPTPVPSGWREIARWTGNGTKSTEIFTVPDEWRLTYTFTGNGYLGVYINYGDGGLFKVAVNTDQPGTDTSIFHEGGKFYLEINSFSGSYTVVVEGLY